MVIKKAGYTTLIIIFLMSLFISPLRIRANGKTLRDLYNELSKLEKDLKEISKNTNLTESRINQITTNIKNIDNEIISIENRIVAINNEIVQLNEEIILKDKEIKELVYFFQLSTGENVYLEYAFGASNMTDFIYRLAVVEQLTKHNNKLIDEMNDMIDSQIQKSKELAQHQKNITIKRKDLFNEQFKLGDKITILNRESLSKEKEIKDAKETIKNYEKLGCKPGDYLETCTNLNRDTGFSRPLEKGRITSEYAERISPITGRWEQHLALDIGGNSTGTPIYATANGTVVHIGFYSCGGNYVTIQHLINGQYYASRYLHMHSINVKVGQKVSRVTVIGTIGGGESYDRCSTGPHLHFQIAKGIFAQDFTGFNLPYTINPRSVINFPPYDVKFSSRY